MLHVSSLGAEYDGICTVMDSGPKVRGRRLDIYMWNCDEAVTFGRRDAVITVLRLGWNPNATRMSG